MASDVAEVSRGGFGKGGYGEPESEGEIGPVCGFRGGFSVFEGGDEAVVGGEGVEVVGPEGGCGAGDYEFYDNSK